MGWRIINGPLVGHWVAERISGGYFAERSNAIGLEKNGEITAGIIYENFNGKSLFAHIAIEGRITPAFLAAIFHYAFMYCNVDKAIVPVRSGNDKSTKFVKHLGFEEEARIRNACPDGSDIIFFSMLKDQCRFLESRYSKRLSVGN